jgi:hypothetical protein
MPIVSELDAAMLQPARFVPAARLLGGGAVRTGDSGRPLRAMGHDAVVYELRMPTGRIVALRCHLRPDTRRDLALAERYSALGADPRLEGLRGAQSILPRGIRWVAEGIAIPGPDLRQAMLPVMAMERIPGRTLVRTVDRLCRERQSEPLLLLADAWLATAAALNAAGFSHGDLAPDNIIVRSDGTLALVDLDSALWPEAPTTAALSDGTPGYAHPRGGPRDLARRDRFPALIIWASLRILARHPELRDRWGDSPDLHGAALLWSADDLRRPGGSALFAALAALSDTTLAPLIEVVRRAIRFPADETPPLAEIAGRLASLGAELKVAPPAPISSPAPWAPPEPAPPAPFAPGAPSSPDIAASLWEDEAPLLPPRQREGHLPDASYTTTVAEKDRRLAAARQVAAAVAARDTATAVKLWEESAAVPEVAAYAVSVHLLVAQDAAAAVDRAARRHDDEGLVAAVAQAELLGVAPSAEGRAALRGARARLAAHAALRDALDRVDLHALARLACAGTLDCLGLLEPAQARAVARARVWPALERALASDDDIAIASAADPALWREADALPSTARDRLDLARRRLRWLDDVRGALRRRDSGGLRTLLASAPPGAAERLTAVEQRRIARVSEREAAVARLERALREGPDREVVAALAEFESAGAPFSDVLDWTAVRGVVDRISLAEAIRTATAADPPDTAQLARLLPAARAALGAQGSPSEPDWAALEQSVLRAAHLARLREALTSGEAARIAAAAAPDPYDAARLLDSDERQRVEHALTQIGECSR